MRYLILAAMLLVSLTGCGSNPQRQEVEVLQPTGAVLYNGPRNLYGTDYNNLTVIYNKQAVQPVVVRPQVRHEPVRWTHHHNHREWGERDPNRYYRHHDHNRTHTHQPRPPQEPTSVQRPRPQVNNFQQNVQRQPHVQRNPQLHPQRVSPNQAPGPRH